MRLRFWLGYAVVASIAIGSLALALVVHDREHGQLRSRRQRERGGPLGAPGGSPGRALGRPARQRRRLLRAGRPHHHHEFDVDRRLAAALRGALEDDRLHPRRAGRPPRAASSVPTASRSSNARPLGFRREPRPRADYFPLIYARLATGHDAAARLRPRDRRRARAHYMPEARDNGRADRDPGDAPADRRHRHQRLPPRLPRRRPDSPPRRAPRRPGRLRDRLLPRPRPDRRGASTLPGDVASSWSRTNGASPAPSWRATNRRRRRCTSPTAPGCSSSATPTGPASACR